MPLSNIPIEDLWLSVGHRLPNSPCENVRSMMRTLFDMTYSAPASPSSRVCHLQLRQEFINLAQQGANHRDVPPPEHHAIIEYAHRFNSTRGEAKWTREDLELFGQSRAYAKREQVRAQRTEQPVNWEQQPLKGVLDMFGLTSAQAELLRSFSHPQEQVFHQPSQLVTRMTPFIERMLSRFPREWPPILKCDELLAMAENLAQSSSRWSLESRISLYLCHYENVTKDTPHHCYFNMNVPDRHWNPLANRGLTNEQAQLLGRFFHEGEDWQGFVGHCLYLMRTTRSSKDKQQGLTAAGPAFQGQRESADFDHKMMEELYQSAVAAEQEAKTIEESIRDRAKGGSFSKLKSRAKGIFKKT